MTAFDWIAGGLLLAFAVFGLARGATRQVAAIIAFIVAAALAIALGRPAGHLLQGMVHPPWLARAVGMTMIFLGVYAAVAFVGSLVTRGLRGVGLSGVDRIFGLALGLGRGLFVLGATGLALGAAFPDDARLPPWIADARLWPLANGAAQAMQSVAPRGLGLTKDVQRQVSQTLADEPQDADHPDGPEKLQVVEDRR